MHKCNPSLLKEQGLINGRWCDAITQLRSAVYNPATGEEIGSVPNMGDKEATQAVDAAENALKSWRQTPVKTRSALLMAWLRLIEENIDDLAQLLTLEQGKPLAEAKGEIQYAASFVQWFAEEAKRINGEILPSHRPNSQILVSREPVGVVAAITPWNFPAAMVTRKCAPALGAGCTLVLKPAPDTPFSALALAHLAQKAGIPDGVINVVTGDAIAIGGVLTGDPRVRKLSFTGSTAVGKILMAQSASSVKKLSLELGGNAPFIVCDDADIEASIEGALLAKFRNAGQTCVCANRIFVQKGIYSAWTEKFAQRVRQFVVGNGMHAGVTIGPLINPQAVEKVRAHAQDAIEKGGQLLVGDAVADGHFIHPMVIAQASDEMRVASEETFGPLAAIFAFDTDEEAMNRANHTDSGLAAYVYTQSLSRAFAYSQGLEYGMVGVNDAAISSEIAPFGGIKSSGLGREGAHQGLEEFLEMKYTLMAGL